MLPECPVHKQVVCCKGCHHQLQILWLLHVLLYAVTDSHQLQIILRSTFPKILMLLTLLISTVRHLCSKLEPSRKSCWGTPWEQILCHYRDIIAEFWFHRGDIIVEISHLRHHSWDIIVGSSFDIIFGISRLRYHRGEQSWYHIHHMWPPGHSFDTKFSCGISGMETYLTHIARVVVCTTNLNFSCVH